MYHASRDEIDNLESTLDILDFGNFACYLSIVASAIDQDGPQDPDPVLGQALNVVEEAGEFIGEFRRVRGFARRPGDREEMLMELADVVISSMIMFQRLDADPESVIATKLKKIVTRGFNNH